MTAKIYHKANCYIAWA